MQKVQLETKYGESFDKNYKTKTNSNINFKKIAKKCCFGRCPNVSTNMMRDHQRKVPTKFGQDRPKTAREVFLIFSIFWPMAQKAKSTITMRDRIRKIPTKFG